MTTKYENVKNIVTVGTVIWEMRGRRRNDTIEWYASPKCVEYTDEHKYLYGDKTGGSWGNIGKNCFLTREDAIEDFLKSHDGLIQKIDINDNTPDGAYELPRTDWQDYEVTLFDGVSATSVYINGFNSLNNVTDMLNWRKNDAPEVGYYGEVLALSEICSQLEKLTKEHSIITVFENGPMKCKVFQCGNYKKGQWVKLGEIRGYA